MKDSSAGTEGWGCGCVWGCAAEGSQQQVRSIAEGCEAGGLVDGCVAGILSGSDREESPELGREGL